MSRDSDKDFIHFSEGQTLMSAGRRDQVALKAITAPAESVSVQPITSGESLEFQIARIGSDDLIEIATPLLALAVRIRDMGEFIDVMRLHAQVENEILGFAKEIENQGYDGATVLGARYCICAMVDESVLSQNWGAESQWSERPMLSIFHNETWGGEKFFTILDRVFDESHRFQALLRFLYLCMALGFEGKYHVMHNGQQKLEMLMTRAVELIEKNNGPLPDKFINPEPNICSRTQRLRRQVPLPLIAGLTVILLAIMFLAFNNAINKRVDVLQSDVRSVLDRGMQSLGAGN